jgi:type IV pilus assembly protein PilQ
MAPPFVLAALLALAQSPAAPPTTSGYAQQSSPPASWAKPSAPSPGSPGGAGAIPASGVSPAARTVSVNNTVIPPPKAAHESGEFTHTATGRLDFHAREIDVADALAQLRQILHKNIVVSPEVRSHFSGDLYDVKPEDAVTAICRSVGLVVRDEGSFLFVGPAELETRVFKLSYIRAEDLLPILKPAASTDGKLTATISAERGIATSAEHAGGDAFAHLDAIAVVDYPKNLDAIASLVKAFDVRPKQILIEATIMSAALTDDLQYGMQLSAIPGFPLSTASVDFDKQTVTTPPISGDVAHGGVATGQTNTLQDLSNEGLKLGFFKGHVGAFLRALQQVTKVDVLATPRVITVNKQRGEVLLGRRDGYITATTTQTTTTQTVQFLETGTKLVYRPYITDDGYVRLEIHPEDSNGGLTTAGLPFKDTTEMTTNVMVKDGDTLVIGGLFRTRKTTVDKSVPILGDIPWLGFLFRSKDTTTVREEILILLTPHIMDGDVVAGDPSASAKPEQHAAAPKPAPDPHADALLLAQAYIDAARHRFDSRDPGGAMLLLDVAHGLGDDSAALDGLRKDAGHAWIHGNAADAIDDLILQKVLADAHGGSRGTPR